MSNLICAATSWIGVSLDRCQPDKNRKAPTPQTASTAEDPEGRSFLEELLFGTSTSGGAVGCGTPSFEETVEWKGDGGSTSDRTPDAGGLDKIYVCDPDGDGIITDRFSDPALLAVIREALGKTPNEDITMQDASKITSLNLYDRGITDLSGIECFANLAWLDATYNQISDLRPLAGLVNLDSLYLYGNQITELGPLAGVVNLTDLQLFNNQISDLGPLDNLLNLERLGLSENQISDLGPLSRLVNLPELNLANNQISDLEPLAALVNLEELGLHFNQIADITPLINNPGLSEGDEVDLRENKRIPIEQIETLRARGVEVIWP